MDEEQLRLAADPATPTETLRGLVARLPWGLPAARPLERRVAEALAANPATPVDDLLTLVHRDPSLLTALLGNPALALLLLAHPDLLGRLGPRHHQRLLADPRTPDALFFDLIERLRSGAIQSDNALLAAVAQSPRTPPELLVRFARDEDKAPGNAPRLLLENPSLPEAAVVRLLGSRLAECRKAAAAHPRCPPLWHALLARCGFPPDLSEPSTARPSDDDLAELLGCNAWMQRYVASCPSLPPALQERIAAEGHAEAAAALARAPDLSPGAARLLAVRPGCRGLLLQRLDIDDEVGRCMLGCGLQHHEVEAMARCPVFSDAIRARLLSAYPRSGLARFFTPTASLLDHLAADRDWEARRCVARAHHTPVDLLERLADDPHRKVRAAAVANPGTPPLYRVSKANRGLPRPPRRTHG